MTEWLLYTSIGVLVGVLVGVFIGYQIGYDVAQSVYPQGIETVWLNKTAATKCAIDYVNATAEIRCAP